MKNLQELKIYLDFSQNNIDQLETLTNSIDGLSKLRSLELFLYQNKTGEEGLSLLTETIS